jgi:hypothetical protein
MSKASFGEVKLLYCGGGVWELTLAAVGCLCSSSQRRTCVLQVFHSRFVWARGNHSAIHDECVYVLCTGRFGLVGIVTLGVGGIMVCPVRHAVHRGSGMSCQQVQVPPHQVVCVFLSFCFRILLCASVVLAHICGLRTSAAAASIWKTGGSTKCVRWLVESAASLRAAFAACLTDEHW